MAPYKWECALHTRKWEIGADQFIFISIANDGIGEDDPDYNRIWTLANHCVKRQVRTVRPIINPKLTPKKKDMLEDGW